MKDVLRRGKPLGVLREAMKYRAVSSINFGPVVFDPGEEREIELRPEGVFRAQRLHLEGRMDPIRGSFRIKRTRRPRLERDSVTAYSRYRKTPSRRRTVVEYHGPAGDFTRTYLPENVVYLHVDPVSYLNLLQFSVDDEKMMPELHNGVSALFFGSSAIGNGLPCATSKARIKLRLRSHGDVQVHLAGAVFGWSL